MCESHFIPYNKLENALLDTVKKTCKNYLKPIDSGINNKKNSEIKNQEKIKELETGEKEYLRKLDMLYEDKFRCMVSAEMYRRIANETEVLLIKLRSEINKLRNNNKIIKDNTDDLKNTKIK